jgi:RNA polymerase sigma-70 factor (ECF subfamily)
MTTQSDRPDNLDESAQRDAGWVRAALAGDTEAFGRLVETYQRRAVGVSYRLLGNSEDAAEVSQEAFLRAYKSLDKLKEPARFGPWLMRIVSNLSLNRRRSRRTGSTVSLDEHKGTETATTSDGRPVALSYGPASQVAGREMQAAIDEAMEQLPEKQRLSLVLFTIDGWPQKDIAEFLECTVENVKWNVFQARKRLKTMLGDMID